jgi:type I restriction enzyme M protein
MSEIVANHLKDRKKIEIYDPTSGSGSLLITIGKSVAKYVGNKDNIKYYAQEWKENTYNLTRMNLIMRGIKPDNIVARCGDTLEDDWPLFDDADPARTYTPLYVDAVISNPPYSQHWDPTNKDTDPRYKRYGLAPKSKADYAFLLHDLYHVKPDGIMTIVLPHGVLFRGGEEGKIRKNLIESNNIEVIISLPANIFFGTGIPTIIMVLRQKRPESDVLFIDASKGFIKAGKNNKLQASDIKKIVDTIIGRKTINKYSRLVSKKEIRGNDYNLNIPRYVDSSDCAESWDIYATMFGGIPNAEIDLLKDYWEAFPHLRNELFKNDGSPYSTLGVDNVKDAIFDSGDVKAFIQSFENAFSDFDKYLDSELIGKMQTMNINQEESAISDQIFSRIAAVPLIDKYKAYQLLDDEWVKISTDLEMIQTEDFSATKQVDPNMVLKKKDGRDEEVQDGWVGHVIPFELVQKTLLKDKYDEVKAKEAQLEDISAEYTKIIDSFSEEEKEGNFLNENNDAFVAAGVKNKLEEIYSDVDSPELSGLYGYLSLIDKKAGKAEKLQYIAEHTEVDWNAIEGKGVYAKSKVTVRIKSLQEGYSFPEDSFEAKLVHVWALMEEEKEVKKEAKELAVALHLLTKTMIENLSDEQVLDFLRLKWIQPLSHALHEMPAEVVNTLVKSVQALSKKYAITYTDLETQIKESKQSLSKMMDELQGNDYDMKGFSEFQKLLKGE